MHKNGHDYSLGGPVSQEGEYTGLVLDGKPLHSGDCLDGVYGCTKCSGALRELTDEQLQTLGVFNEDTCEWCKKVVKLREMTGLKAWDEPCYYEVCLDCSRKYWAEYHKMVDEE